MARPSLEVADIFRDHGPAWRTANAGHLSQGQLKVMAAIEPCRTGALGGHVARCERCAHTQIAYNSCRNRHCPTCQGAAAKAWLAARQAELLPVAYDHVVFTLPAPVAALAWQNKAVVYDLLFRAAAETLVRIAADPKHLGARIGLTAVLHTWGSALTHHPHVHVIVPGGGISADGSRWIACRPGFFLPVRVLSRLFRRLFLGKLAAARANGRLQFFGNQRPLADPKAFAAFLAPLRKAEWVVYACAKRTPCVKRPFAGPAAVLAYLSRYTHRVAIANSRLIAVDDAGVSFRWKDYRADGRARYKSMTLATGEFIRRFLLHVLPAGFHRIRHDGLFASGQRRQANAVRPSPSGHRPAAGAARRGTPAGGRRRTGAGPSRRRLARADVRLPLLRRADGDHREVRPRRQPHTPAGGGNGCFRDRQLMNAPAPQLRSALCRRPPPASPSFAAGNGTTCASGSRVRRSARPIGSSRPSNPGKTRLSTVLDRPTRCPASSRTPGFTQGATAKSP